MLVALLVLGLASPVHTEEGAQTTGDRQIQRFSARSGEVVARAPRSSPGARFSLEGGALLERRPSHRFSLASSGRGGVSCDCLCGDEIFADGFESGDTLAWQ